jgi:hypothetical protein
MNYTNNRTKTVWSSLSPYRVSLRAEDAGNTKSTPESNFLNYRIQGIQSNCEIPRMVAPLGTNSISVWGRLTYDIKGNKINVREERRETKEQRGCETNCLFPFHRRMLAAVEQQIPSAERFQINNISLHHSVGPGGRGEACGEAKIRSFNGKSFLWLVCKLSMNQRPYQYEKKNCLYLCVCMCVCVWETEREEPICENRSSNEESKLRALVQISKRVQAILTEILSDFPSSFTANSGTMEPALNRWLLLPSVSFSIHSLTFCSKVRDKHFMGLFLPVRRAFHNNVITMILNHCDTTMPLDTTVGWTLWLPCWSHCHMMWHKKHFWVTLITKYEW